MPKPAATPSDTATGQTSPTRWAAEHTARWPALAVIALGGALGALARYGLLAAFPRPASEFAWATFGINVSGCLLIGVLMVLVDQVWPARRLLRPFLGVGVLGGFTTFSSYVLDSQLTIAAGATSVGLAYLIATVIGALTAVWIGAAVTGAALRLIRDVGRDHGSNP